MTRTIPQADWQTLDALRRGFLSPGPGGLRDYWSSNHALEQYDATFAQRIRWKWDAVLDELRANPAWTLPGGMALLDWGCGTGVAARAFLSAFPAMRDGDVMVSDRSGRACDFALGRIRDEHAPARLSRWSGGELPAGTVVLVSHVLDELPGPALQALLALLHQAEAVVWVEPGTQALGRALAGLKATLLDRFTTVAPCPHDGPCGLLQPGRERDWCHFFAPPPPQAFQDRRWSEFGRRMGIDLRSLPTSFLAMRRAAPSPVDCPPPQARILGRPRPSKGLVSCLGCDPSGAIVETRVLRSHDRATHDRLRDGGFCLRVSASIVG
jgi:ribosomal protein RSM22 (predicted rRNA methylase)